MPSFCGESHVPHRNAPLARVGDSHALQRWCVLHLNRASKHAGFIAHKPRYERLAQHVSRLLHVDSHGDVAASVVKGVDSDLEIVAPPAAKLYEGAAVQQEGVACDLAGGSEQTLVDGHSGGGNASVNYSFVADGA
jgi:hypothetical protein